MLTKLGCLIFLTILFKAENILCEDSANGKELTNVGVYDTEVPKENCFNFKIKTNSSFHIFLGTINDDKSFNNSFYLYLGYKYPQEPTEQFNGLFDDFLKKFFYDDFKSNFINPNEYTEFWLKLHNNMFEIGVKSNPEPFMVHKYFKEVSAIRIAPAETTEIENLVIPAHFECPKDAKDTIVDLGINGYYLMPTPKDKCLTFKIKTEPFFRLFFGTINENYDFSDSFYVYMGWEYAGKPGQYSGLYDHSSKKYAVYDKLTPNLLSGKDYQEFFVKWVDNEFKIGFLNDEPLMTHKFVGNAEDYYIKIAAHDKNAVLIFKEDAGVCPGH